MVDALQRASAGARSPRRCRTSATRARTAGRARRGWRSAPRWWRTCSPRSGVDRVLTMDLHADQIQGFFDIPVDNIYAAPILLGDVWKHELREPGRGVARRRRRGAGAGAREAARVATSRSSTSAGRGRTCREVMNIIGEVKGRTCVIMDDMVDTANTLCEAARGAEGAGRDEGGRVLHAPGAVGRRGASASPSSALDELVVTDTIPLREDARACKKIRVAVGRRACSPRRCCGSATRTR